MENSDKEAEANMATEIEGPRDLSRPNIDNLIGLDYSVSSVNSITAD